MITIIRWAFLPFSLLYQFIIWLRNRMYDYGILKSRSFSTPTIVIGNLAIGGAGKSPMTEYLIRLLKDKYKIATLSRGYGRKTKGFKLVNSTSTAVEVGDEPLQFKSKFPAITVAVCEDRCKGIDILEPQIDLILLDDAYQHRKLKAGFNILLFDFQSLISKTRFTLPTGDFRDIFSSSKRADLIIITKCPHQIAETHKNQINKILNRYAQAPIFYSSIKYNLPIAFNDQTNTSEDLENYEIVLFCGIANPKPLIEYLKAKNNRIHLLTFPDHHIYLDADFMKIKACFDAIKASRKIILTTEKDIQRIQLNDFSNYPLFYLPISIDIQNNQSSILNQHIESYLNQLTTVN